MRYLDFQDVLIRPSPGQLNSRSEASLIRHFEIRDLDFRVCPIIAANMDGVGTIPMLQSLAQCEIMTALTKFHDYNMEGYHPYNGHAFISMGVSEEDLKRFTAIASKFSVPFLNIDIANGYIPKLADTIRYIRDRYPDIIIMAGNVATREGVYNLALAGADIIKVGIGGGSVCTTRLMTGVGVPQLSAIQECVAFAKEWNEMQDSYQPLYICSDGGCTSPGDIAKAFVAGADFVMIGGMLAGHKEGGATVENFQTDFYGMASKEAIDKHFHSKESYTAEGKRVTIPFRGDVSHTAKRIQSGLRSAMTYTNCASIEDFKKCSFIEVNHQLNNTFGQTSFG